MRNPSLLLWVLLFVDGVFGATEVSVSVSVMKGDSVTLHTGVSELQSDDIIEWMREDDLIIAEVKNNKYEIRSFKGRLELDHKTGSLTIKNITSRHEGTYILDIGGRNLISKNFTVTVHGAAKTVSVKEEEPVTLHTGFTDIQIFDLILWKFEDHLIAEINKGTNQFIVREISEVRFKGRLQVNGKTGSLTISGSETTDSGNYDLTMSNKMCTLHRTFSVTVKATPKVHTEDPGLHPAYTALICVCIVVLVAVTVACVICCCCKKSGVI